MLLWRSKEVLAQANGVTCYGSRYSVVDIIVDIDLLIKLLFEIKIFDTQFGKGADGTEFKDLYTQEFIAINNTALL